MPQGHKERFFGHETGLVPSSTAAGHALPGSAENARLGFCLCEDPPKDSGFCKESPIHFAY
jgi:hypothetical protein